MSSSLTDEVEDNIRAINSSEPTIKWEKQAAYIYDKLQPGFTKQIGQVVESEDKLKRIGGMLTGLKQYEFDIPKAFKYKSQAFGYGRKLPNIKKAYKKNIIDKSLWLGILLN